MQPRGVLALLVLAGALLAGCSDDRSPAVPPPGPAESTVQSRGQSPRPMPGEEYLFKIEKQVPGFGGMYYDDEGDLVIFLKDLRLAGAARDAVRPYLFGPGKRGVPDGPPAALKFRQGRFSVVELNEHWQQVNQFVFEVPGVVSTDVDEGLNAVLVRVRDEAARREVLAAVARRSVPDGAVRIQVMEPCDPDCGEPGITEPAIGEELAPAPQLAEGDTTSVADGSVAPDSPPNREPGAVRLLFFGPGLLGYLNVT